VLTKEDFQSAAVEKSKTVDIMDFVEPGEIDDRYFDTPYYAVPGKGADRSYAVLREGIRKSGRIGVGKIVLRETPHLVALTVVEDALVLTMMRFADELVDVSHFKLPANKDVRPKEVEMATKLIESLSEDWQPEKYKDDYRSNLMRVIDAKLKGKELEVEAEPAAVPTQVGDLIDRLREACRPGAKRGARAVEPAAPDATRRHLSTVTGRPDAGAAGSDWPSAGECLVARLARAVAQGAATWIAGVDGLGAARLPRPSSRPSGSRSPSARAIAASWLLENLLTFATVPAAVFTFRKFRFSNQSYLQATIFLILHTIGSHYTYAEVPAGDWAASALGLERNHYDRLVHFCFGLLLLRPMRELTIRRPEAIGPVATSYLAFASVAGLPARARIVGWLIASSRISRGHGLSRHPGRCWDAQRTALATVSAAIATGFETRQLSAGRQRAALADHSGGVGLAECAAPSCEGRDVADVRDRD
jgi:DNA end-binding protein Ku